MKKYIGTKLVQATPAIRKNGKVYLPTDAIPRTMGVSEEGYKVVHEDGHESWLPKDVFEKAYKVADTPLNRMYIEYNELMDKYNKLVLFLGRKDAVVFAGENQVDLMEVQKVQMHDYLLTLKKRIDLMKE
ncbi:hypothetical protein IX307_001393 [Bacteroides pyogenes]|uniref:crAss001_48 related protein n=1 Tax=Bacteroides pyogenes TaxID=310300 RepID=UPI001BAD8270|nr:hypothetical protein [Bacteroides pyogenes]MBR8720183.1 hypothetical protein [Bacteroides pyogenes]MBR8787072.1 hypothetical protein [Bacteroides pyogenes]MBR8792560.1 hypothetical protein [Bacteroides pyogenes]